jgi:triacylglycerol lipase
MTSPPIPHPSRNPVILVHGIDDTGDKFRYMVPVLQQQGWQTHALSLVPKDGSAGLEHLAQQVHRYIEQHFAAEQPIDLLGFSMGGIVSRYYLQRLGGIKRVQRFITVSSPHHGTWMGYARWNKGAEQMRCGSDFLAELNRDLHQLAALNVTSMWTPLDLMIVPADSSALPIGTNKTFSVALHPWMVRDRQVIQAVIEALSEPLRVSPM